MKKLEKLSKDVFQPLTLEEAAQVGGGSFSGVDHTSQPTSNPDPILHPAPPDSTQDGGINIDF